MDPDKALADLIDAVLRGDFDQAEEALDALKHWHDMGGFGPADPRATGREEPW